MAACRDVFHLLAVEDEGEGWAGRFGATHPPLERRIERLERMEQALQAARLPVALRDVVRQPFAARRGQLLIEGGVSGGSERSQFAGAEVPRNSAPCATPCAASGGGLV